MAYHRRGPGSGSGPASSSSSGFHFLNSSFGDTTYTKVFVGGLAWDTNSESLRHHFEQFGHILEAVVIADKGTGRSKGDGFVTFKEPESAQRACEDPTPVIDGRRANCNLASLRRLQPSLSSAQPRSSSPYVGGVPIPQGAYMGNATQQQPAPFIYQQGFQYPTFSYAPYGPEYVYPQNVYNPYMGQLYYQVYGVPGAVNTAVFPPGQFGQPISSAHGYVAVQGYTTPGHHILQIDGPSVNGVTSSTQPAIQTPYPAGLVVPITTQAHFIISAPSPQYTHENGSEQAAS